MDANALHRLSSGLRIVYEHHLVLINRPLAFHSYPIHWRSAFLLFAMTAIVNSGASSHLRAQDPAVFKTVAAPAAVTPATATTPTDPLDAPLQMARRSLLHSQTSVNDYSATLIKRTRVDGDLPEHQFLSVKIRNRKRESGQLTIPMGVYVLFNKPESSAGREVIWVEGQNNGEMIAHEAGYKNLMRLSLDPNGYLAMRGQKYPITDIGIENLLIKIIDTAERERGHEGTVVQLYRGAKVGNRVCTMIQVTHPTERAPFEFYRAQVFFDEELNLPIRYASWGWPKTPSDEPPLEEEYTYLNVQLNVGLTPSDFDPDNPAYNYP